MDAGIARFVKLNAPACFRSIGPQARLVAAATDHETHGRLVLWRQTGQRNRGGLDHFNLNGLRPQNVPAHVDLSRTASLAKGGGFHTAHRLYMVAAYALVRKARGRASGGANIGAVLAVESGEVVAWGLNTNWSNHTFHAEVNTIESFIKRGGNPADGRRYVLYTTLKPCCMCAGMIEVLFGNNVTVYYGQDDTGAHARNTALTNTGREHALCTPGPNPPATSLKPVRFNVTRAQTGSMETAAVPAQGKNAVGNLPSGGSVTREQNMVTLLGQTYQTYRNRGVFVIRFLREAEAIYLMDCAVECLKHKNQRYQNEQAKRQNVIMLEAINYLYPFLQAHGLT